MKKWIAFTWLQVVVQLFLVSCGKTKDIGSAQLNSFLNDTIPQFIGTLDGTSFSVLGKGPEFQVGSGMTPNTDDSKRMVFYSINASSTVHPFVHLATPYYDVTSDASVNQFFSTSSHPTGSYGQGFNLSIGRNGIIYQTNAGSGGTAEILKTTAFETSRGKTIRVWLRFETRMSNCNCPDNNTELKDGLMIAELVNYRK